MFPCPIISDMSPFDFPKRIPCILRWLGLWFSGGAEGGTEVERLDVSSPEITILWASPSDQVSFHPFTHSLCTTKSPILDTVYWIYAAIFAALASTSQMYPNWKNWVWTSEHQRHKCKIECKFSLFPLSVRNIELRQCSGCRSQWWSNGQMMVNFKLMMVNVL